MECAHGSTVTRVDDQAQADTLRHAARHLEREGPSFGFYSLVEAVEGIFRASASGASGRDVGKRVRFRHDASLGFPAGDVASVQWVEASAGGGHFVITTSFLGLTGSGSPLPLHLSEEIVQQEESLTTRDFLDIFHHRLVDCVVQIEKRSRVGKPGGRGEDFWSDRILALAGIDGAASRRLQDVLSRDLLLRISGLAMVAFGSAEGLELALQEVCSDVLEAPVVVLRQFAGSWTPLDHEQSSLLGGRCCALGLDLVLGTRCRDVAGKAIITVQVAEPLLDRFLSGGDCHERLRTLVNWWCVEPVSFDLELEVQRPKSAGCRLGAPDACLSRRAWLAEGVSTPETAGGPRPRVVRVPLC